jgi:hypothetical protein
VIDQRSDRNLTHLAKLVQERNRVAGEITSVIGRPGQIGHLGEYIASKVFDIRLEESASSKAIDGYFSSGPLNGLSVNIKWYAKLEFLLDITPDALPDYYLVMTGPKTKELTSKGKARPWLIEFVFLFEAKPLVRELNKRGLKIGIATSVRQTYWQKAEIYPRPFNRDLLLSDEQKRLLRLFSKVNAPWKS